MTSCFGEAALAAGALGTLDAVIAQRANDPAARKGNVEESTESYTRRLLNDRNLRLKKIGEESTEFALACADDDKERAVEEAADLFYHLLVALRSTGATLDDLRQSLTARRKSTRDP